MNSAIMSVRELQEADIALIADYWSTSDRKHLLSMGVDAAKLPTRSDFIATLSAQLALPLAQRPSYFTVWQIDAQSIGHCNVNKIRFGCEAYMHLHLWHPNQRGRGLGSALVRRSVRYFFERLDLQDLYCEPYALNPAPHAVLAKAGFAFVKDYTTVPGAINFEQPVKRWHMSRSHAVATAGEREDSADP
jgi:RimJ/RimL family protein N-acetyltransferase